MKIQTLKWIIRQLNEAAIETGDLDKIFATILAMDGEGTSIQLPTLQEAVAFLKQMKLVRQTPNTFHLYPCSIIYAKTAGHSQLEALALYEMGLHHYKEAFQDDFIQWSQLPDQYRNLLKESSLTDHNRIADEHHSYCRSIRKEYQKSILSSTLSVLYTDYIVDRTGPIEYKNTKKEIAEFPYKDWILEVMPERGVPVNREVSKELQIFYKDTLMHEFDKTCPICHVRLSKMLIGSHIKPFRDCAHLYEAACHDNGLLLCRNHDILFDQGYMTFDDEGHAIITEELEEKKDLYQIHDLDPVFMSEERKLFLDYHRKHIFRKK